MSQFKFLKKTILMFSTAMLAAPFAYAETLEGAVTKTLAKHPQVESALASVKGAEQERKEQRSGYFPELSVSATGGRIFGNNSTSRGLSVTRGEGYSYLWEGSVTARQKLFDGFETKNRVNSAKATEQAAVLELADVRESLAFRAVQTYVSLVRVHKGLGMLQGQEKSVKNYLSRISQSVDDGAADESELQQARDVSVILDNFIADYEGQARALASDFSELTGYLPGDELVEPSAPLENIPENVEDAIAIAKEKHPLLRSAQYQAQSAKHEISAEKSALIPKFDGELSYLKKDQDDIIGGEVEDGKAVVRMNWTYEMGGAQHARVKRRTYEHHEAQARINEVERGIERAVRQAYAEHDTAQRQFENQKRRMDLNKKLLDTYEVQFEGARISLLQLMQADNQVLITDLERTNAKSRVLLARYGILAAMGQLQDALGVQIAEVQGMYPAHEP